MERLVLAFVCLGMIASLVAFVSYTEALKNQLKSDEFYSASIVKSQLYYVAHAAEIALLVSAGLVALLSADWQAIERGYLLRFALFLGAVLLMTARGYSFSELLSTKLMDSTGPFPLIMSVLVFIGSRRRNWTVLGPIMVIMAVVFSALVLMRMAGLHTFTRQEGVANLGGTVHSLYWPASWMALKDYPQQTFARRLRFGPIVIFGLGSLFTQTRLNLVMIFALLVVYAYLQRRRRIPQAPAWIIGLMLTVWVGLFTTVLLADTRAFEKVASVVDSFSSRLTEDTRTGQVARFAESVELHELVLGRGSLATWNWGGVAWRGGTDIGYLTLLFYGGVPLLVTYVATHVKPCLAVLSERRTSWQLVSAGVVLLWGIHMLSSCYPDTVLDYYPVLFCMGACISREPSQQARPCHGLHETFRHSQTMRVRSYRWARRLGETHGQPIACCFKP